MDTRLERLKADPRIKYVAAISGDRHIIKVKLEDIHVHDDLKKIRGSQPKSIALLKSSIKDISDGDSLYCVSLYMPDGEGEPEYFIGDGLQRYNAMVGNGEKNTYAQVVLKWRSLKDAMEAGVSANMARFKMDENDVFSLMDTGLLIDRDIMRLTDYKESTVARIRKVHDVGWLRKLVDKPKQALPYTRAAKLAAACGKDDDRFAALKVAMDEILAAAEDNADYYEQQGRSSKMTKKDAKKTTLKYWFDEQKDRLDLIASQLENGKIEEVDGVFRVIEGTSSGNVAVVVGLSSEWEKRPAISNFFGTEWDKLTREDVVKVKKALPKIGEYLDQQIKRMTRNEEPMRSSSDRFIEKHEKADSKPPKKQESTSVPNNE